ncbi:Vitelline membrane outer layer protein 1 [Armadillidium vulgare]|nr:Vitelline membrane outer layer protein 1 [Armadillidium vulgare]
MLYPLVDREEKNFSDEEGMTGIRLFCSDENGDQTAIISSFSLRKGNWKGANTCPPQEWMTAFRIRIQKYSGWVKDDTGANNLEMVCNYTNIYNGRGNNRGDWTEWIKCPQGEIICGLRTKIEDIFTADRSGLVAVNFMCCEHSDGENQTINGSSNDDDVTYMSTTVHSTSVNLHPTYHNNLENFTDVQDITTTSATDTTPSTMNTTSETTELPYNETLSTPSENSEVAWETFPANDGPLTPSFSSRLRGARLLFMSVQFKL